MTGKVSAAELRQFIERLEANDAEGRDVMNDRKEILAEAKGRGYDLKAMKAIVAMRRKKADEIAEFDAVLDLYKLALGMV